MEGVGWVGGCGLLEHVLKGYLALTSLVMVLLGFLSAMA